MVYDLEKKYKEEVVPEMINKLGCKNKMAIPRLVKVVVNTGVGSIKDQEKKVMIEEHLAILTGQKVSKRPAKKSIASFKLREGNIIGYSVTLRGNRMYDFLNKLIFVTIPRKRDFRGLDSGSVDESGNLSIGFKDHLVFPEMVGQDIKNAFGLSVTVVTTAKDKDEAVELFKLLGFPFKRT